MICSFYSFIVTKTFHVNIHSKTSVNFVSVPVRNENYISTSPNELQRIFVKFNTIYTIHLPVKRRRGYWAAELIDLSLKRAAVMIRKPSYKWQRNKEK